MADAKKRWHVLIVDDSPVNLDLLTLVLEESYEVTAVRSGKEALKAVSSHKIDLILLDVMMPGLNGYEVCRQLKQHPQTKRIPVIFITAMEASSDEQMGFSVGAADYITKPISAPTVLARIETHLKLYDQTNAFEHQLQERTKELQETNQRLADALKSAQKADQLKQQFLATLGHELRTPLNGITGALQLLKDTIRQTDSQELLEMANQSALNLAQLLDNILTFIETQAGELVLKTERTELQPFFEAHIQNLQHMIPGTRLHVDLDEIKDTVVEVDSRHLTTVFYQLMDNAIKFCPDGKISFRATLKQKHNVSVLHLYFKDTGIGFQPEKLENVWALFRQVDGSFSRKQQGIGIGLPLTKGLVEAMGGQIHLHSIYGSGTEVEVSLPTRCHLSSTITTHQPTLAAEKIAPPITILVVEDNPVNMKLTKKLLEKMGYHTLEALNGQVALDVFTKPTPFINLILMDCQMPIMDGYEACRRIRILPNGATVPIIALTANVSASDVANCLAAGMNDHLGKPVRKEKLQETIAKWLNSAASKRRQ